MQFDAHADRVLIIDVPLNFARQRLKQLGDAQLYTVAVTANLCPEYIEDIWDMQPTILLVGDDMQQDVIAAMLQVANGQRYRRTPTTGSPLDQMERTILRGIAWGWETDQIAERLGLAEKTVRNKLSAVYALLGLRNRADATRYYFDIRPIGDEP